MVTTGREREHALRCGIDAIPNREIHAVIGVHREHRVQVREHLRRIAEVGVGNCSLPQHVQHAHRMHRGGHAVTGDVDQERGDVLIVEHLIAEHVPAELQGRTVEPVRAY
jgi:hypothetical protein